MFLHKSPTLFRVLYLHHSHMCKLLGHLISLLLHTNISLPINHSLPTSLIILHTINFLSSLLPICLLHTTNPSSRLTNLLSSIRLTFLLTTSLPLLDILWTNSLQCLLAYNPFQDQDHNLSTSHRTNLLRVLSSLWD